jgi:nicotinamidase-related amidase
MKTALLLIDIQNDYFPGGKMEVKGSTEAALAARKLLTYFREHALPVIHIQHVSVRPGATFLLPDTPGVEIHESVTPLPDEKVFRKNYPSAFRDTLLLDHLKERDLDKLTICGMMTHMCVDSTVRAAFDYGFRNVLVSDACATRDLSYDELVIPAEQVHAAFVAALGAMFAQITTVDDLLAKAV